MAHRLSILQRVLRQSPLFLILALVLPATALAAPPCPEGEECHEAAAYETPRGMALGTGNRASAYSTSALVYNTAGMPSVRLYHIEGDVDYQPSNDVVVLGASVIDSVTSRLAAGLAFRGTIANSHQGYNGIDFLLGLGFPFADAVSIGVSGRYVNLWDDADHRLVKGLTMDTSLRVQPVEMLHLAVLAYNVIDRNSEYVPVTLGGSTSLVLGGAFNVGADCLVDISTFEEAKYLMGGGLEYVSGGTLPLRIGYQFDSGRETHAITGGVGYTGDKFSADLALRQQVAGGSATRVMAGVRFHIY
jgi:hypothetical protein